MYSRADAECVHESAILRTRHAPRAACVRPRAEARAAAANVLYAWAAARAAARAAVHDCTCASLCMHIHAHSRRAPRVAAAVLGVCALKDRVFEVVGPHARASIGVTFPLLLRHLPCVHLQQHTHSVLG
jgi:hypothetical protein